MSIEYIDLVLCHIYDDPRKRPYLFFAPAFSNLEKGNKVIVDAAGDQKFALVEACCTVGLGDSCYEALIVACKATLPLKRVLSRLIYVDFNYKEEPKDGEPDQA